MAYESFSYKLRRLLGLEPEPGKLTPLQAQFGPTQERKMLVEAWSDATRTVLVRGYNKDQVINGKHITNSDRSKSSQFFIVTELPTYLVVQLVETGVRRGQCYVRVTYQLFGFAVQLLCSGYVHDGGTLAWPNGANESMNEGAGFLREVQTPAPGAGTAAIITVPTNARWNVIWVFCQLTTSAVAGTRRVNMSVIPVSGNQAFFNAGIGQGPGLTRDYTFAPGVTDTTVDQLFIKVSIGNPLYAFQGQAIQVFFDTGDGGDSFSKASLLVEEWIEE